jgi:hypothetical protein
MVSGWPTPSSEGSAGETSADLERRGEKWVNSKTGRVLQTNLATDVKMLAGWATPAATEARQGFQDRSKGMKGTQESFTTQVVKTSGQTPSGSTAETEKPGGLNPAFASYLQGYPVEWCQAAIRASRKLKTRPKRG